MIEITVKGLAKFITVSPANQRKIVRDFKYPKEEGFAQTIYYREGRNLIHKYYESGLTPEWLRKEAHQLRVSADVSEGPSATRLKHNARGVEQYAAYFAERRFEILEDIRLSITVAGVRIKVTPDLHVRERGKPKMIKLEFANKEPDDSAVRIVCQTMFEAALKNGYQLTPACVLYLDVPRGKSHKGARAGARVLREIEAACQNISALWEDI